MIIFNIGTIALSLPAQATLLQSMDDSFVAFQVKLISVANTLARIIVGPLADYVSPVNVHHPDNVSAFPRKYIISRFAFLSGSATLLIFTFLWLQVGVQSQSQLWALR